jgi:N-acetylmuramoyl-L-alanine amidase
MLLLVLSVTLASACSEPASWIKPADGPLVLELVYPPDGTGPVPDSTAIWGTVGTGRARLEVNGQPVAVEANGAFAGFVPVPAGDSVTLEIVASVDDAIVRRSIRLSRVSAGPRTEPAEAVRPVDRWVRLSRHPNDTVDSATQARPVFTRWAPGGELALPIEQGIRVFADVRTDAAVRLRLAPDMLVWAAASEVDTVAAERPNVIQATDLRIDSDIEETVVSLSVPEAVPTHAEQVPGGLVWTLFGVRPGSDVGLVDPAGLVLSLTFEDAGPARVRIVVVLPANPLGWKSEYRDGRQRLRIRSSRPLESGLQGLIIGLDAGHPPGGTTGPAGLREDSMTLAVARQAADRLRALGAEPVLIRNDADAVSLDERILRAEAAGVHVYVSIHGNSPGPGRPPTAVSGTLIYWLESNSFTLGRAMLDEVARALGQPPTGLLREDFAVIRTNWYPAVLVEGVGMTLPEREAYLRTPDGIGAYAAGIVAGLQRWAANWPRQGS